jgi:hypothetical protein
MDTKGPNPTSIINIFHTVEELVCDVVNKDEFYVPIAITTEDGLVNTIEISNSKEDNFSVNKNIILYKNKAINLNKIVKIKILTENINSNKLKTLLLNSLGNLTIYNYDNINEPACTRKRRVQNFNAYTTDEFDTNDNIQDYIIKNMKNIKTINYNKASNNASNYITANTSKENVLNSDTNLYIKRKSTLEDVDLDIDTLNVVSSIKKDTQNILTDIKTEEKLVLTNNSEEVEVSKPINTQNINVLSDINIKNCNIATNQSPSQAINKINQNQMDAITHITPYYLEDTISSIDIQRQIIPPKTVEVLDLIPASRYVSKHELDGKLLRLDPTGENYIGVFLDDGSFEPLRLTFKTFNVIPEDTINIVGNIYRSQLRKVLTNLDISKDPILESIDISYNNNLLEYQPEGMLPLNELITTSKSTIKNITNEVETASVITKNRYEVVNSVKNIEHDTIDNVGDIKLEPVVNSIELSKSNQQLIDDIDLDKNSSTVVKNLEIINNKISSTATESINGVVEFAGNGLMVVNNEDSDISIYSIPKLSSVN